MSGLWLFIVSYLLGLFGLSKQQSTPDDLFYVAGVVEFATPEFKYRNETSAQEYIDIIKSVDAQTTDIIVFPEQTLNSVFTPSYVSQPTDELAPCDDVNGLVYEQFLIDISCAARSTKKYIIINILEKADCTEKSQQAIGDDRPCANDGLNKYNTNVVFNRNGVVVSRYRKWNLWGEFNKNTTYKPEYGVFDTDFGVRFGHFICFDIMFYTPIQELVEKGITDFIFPSMWFAELPFLTGLQIQEGWSYSNDVNLLASGSNQPKVGSSGTGIYAGKEGPIVAAVHAETQTKLYVAKVPKKGSNQHVSAVTREGVGNRGEFFFKRDKIDDYMSIPFEPFVGKLNATLCQLDLCCSFKINMTKRHEADDLQSYSYRMVLYNGVRTYTGFADGYLRTCSLIACMNGSMSTCGTVFPSDVRDNNSIVFEQIQIEGEFRDDRKMLIMPNSLDTSLLPVNVKDFRFEIDDHNVKYELVKPMDNLLTFGIYANVYDVENGTNGMVVHMPLLLLSSFITIIIFYK